MPLANNPQDGLVTLESNPELPPRKRMALVVRAGEGRILAAAIESLREEEETLKAQAAIAKNDKKRKATDEGKGGKRGGKVIR